MSNVAVIFAGGTGKRMGIDDIPKQFLEIAGKPIIIHTIEKFDNHPEIDGIVVVCVSNWIGYLKEILNKYEINKVKSIVEGGATGQDSIYNGLIEAEKFYSSDDTVLIHDGVRPLIDEDLISRNIKDTALHGNSITATICNETFILSRNGVDIDNVPVRRHSYNAQAPQAFRLGEIIEAHEQIRKVNPDYEDIPDSCTLFINAGKPVFITEGVRGNVKITNPIDTYIFEAWLKFKENRGKALGTESLVENDRNK